MEEKINIRSDLLYKNVLGGKKNFTVYLEQEVGGFADIMDINNTLELNNKPLKHLELDFSFTGCFFTERCRLFRNPYCCENTLLHLFNGFDRGVL